MARLSFDRDRGRVYALPALILAHDKALIDVIEHQDLDVSEHPARLDVPSFQVFANAHILRHLIRALLPYEPVDLQDEILEQSLQYLDLVSSDVKVLQARLSQLDDRLLLRSCIVGHVLTLADRSIWGLIRGNRVAYGIAKTSLPNIKRWLDFVETQLPWANDIISHLVAHNPRSNAVSKSLQPDSGVSSKTGGPESTPIVTRFPPEPSGYLHIGHAKAALLNDYFARQHADGKLICRFDDTNPTKEKAEFQDAILEDLKTMEIHPDQITFSSDYFDVLFGFVEKMIKSGHAYADDSEKSAINAQRDYKLGFTPSPHRDDSIEQNMSRLRAMKEGTAEGLRWSIRAKIDYKNVNGALRDPVIYRCNLTPHHRTGTTWKVYPTYDFCAPILDSVEGVTLALRSNEYCDRNAQYEWFQSTLGLRIVTIQDFSRLNFQKTVLSKRMLKQLVESDKVSGWDDPRMPTIRGVVRHGLSIPALREFILKQGPSKNILNLDWSGLWALNRKHIDRIAPKYFAIEADRAVSIEFCPYDGPLKKEFPCHPRYPELGTKAVHYAKEIMIEYADARTLKVGEEITLMNWGNARITGLLCDDFDNSYALEISARLNLTGDVKTTTKKITWLPHWSGRRLLRATLSSYGDLLTVDKFDSASMNILDVVNTSSERRVDAYVDASLANLKVGSIVQFERKGYFRLDAFAADGTANFIEIPNGKL